MERAHLLKFCKENDIDRAEIDHKISYEENKEYLDQLAARNGMSNEDKRREDRDFEKWKGAYSDFMQKVSDEENEQWKDYLSSED